MAAAAGGNGKPAGTASVAHTTYRSASVLLVGWSSTHNTTAVLLGGGEGRHGSYRYSDFGGGLDGGSKRHGGTYSRSKEEKDYPHLGAFRELAEEFFGLKGDRARDFAARVWDCGCSAAVELVPLRGHLCFVLPIKALTEAMGEGHQPPQSTTVPGKAAAAERGRGGGGVGGGAGGGGTIESLSALFVKNNEVTSVAPFSIGQLLADVRVVPSDGGKASKSTKSSPLVAVWGTTIPKQKHLHFFSSTDCVALDAMKSARADPNQEYLTTDGKMLVRPIRMTQRLAAGGGRHLDVFRWDRVDIRPPMAGTSGSLQACAKVLSAQGL